MTYTKHRSTQETLQTLDSLGLDTVRSANADLIKKFEWDDDSYFASHGQLTMYKRIRMIIWQLFEEPRSSVLSKVNKYLIIFLKDNLFKSIRRLLLLFRFYSFFYLQQFLLFVHYQCFK